MNYVIFCDESRHDNAPENRFMAIGGLWVPRDKKAELTKRFKSQKALAGLRGEAKWSKVSLKKLDGYKRLVDFFFLDPDIRFRVIVVDQSKIDARTFHGNDRELGFYKFYFSMLEKWLTKGDRFLVLLDFKMNSGAGRYSTLRRVLENTTRGAAWIDDLTVIDSRESPLAQLTDLLTGATAARWCGLRANGPKDQLASHIGYMRGAPLDSPDPGPGLTKFNIFAIKLQ